MKTIHIVMGAAVLGVAGCGGGHAEMSERSVCGDGVPGSMTIAEPVTEGGTDRLAVVCWRDTTHAEPGWVTIYEAEQDGAPVKTASHEVGRQPQTPVIADLDGDDVQDLLVDNTGGLSDEHYLAFLKGRPDGTFEEGARLPSIGADFVIHDINSDDMPDFVLPGDRAALIVRDLQEGRFRRRGLPEVEGQNVSGDVVPGADGAERFAALLDRDASKLHVYPSGGNGGFSAAYPEDMKQPHSVLGIADMNGDARPDMVVAVQKDDPPIERRLHLLLSTGDEAWELSPAIEQITQTPRRIAFAPVSGGNKLHVFISPGADPDGGDRFIDHVIVDAGGQVRAHGSIELPHFPYALAVADFGAGDTRELLVRNMDGGYITRIPVAQFEED